MDNKAYEMSRRIMPLATMFAILLTPVFALAARPDVPPGQVSPAEAYDYRNFTAPAVSHREFTVTNGGGVVRIIEVLDRSLPGEVLIHRSFNWETGDSYQRDYHFLITESDVLWDTEDRMTQLNVFDPPLSIRQSVMPKGVMQASSAVKGTWLADTLVAESGVTRFNVALGVEDVHLALGTLPDCLRLYEEHDGRPRMSWFCPDFGLAKRIYGDNGAIWELDLSTCVGCPSL